MAEGKSTREIADRLFISFPTVNRHRFNIKHKHALKSNVDLVRYAIEKGYSSQAQDAWACPAASCRASQHPPLRSL